MAGNVPSVEELRRLRALVGRIDKVQEDLYTKLTWSSFDGGSGFGSARILSARTSLLDAVEKLRAVSDRFEIKTAGTVVRK